MGNPTRLTDALIEEIVRSVRRGTPPKYAAEAMGVPYHTFCRWLQIGRGAIVVGSDWEPSASMRKKCERFVRAIEQAGALAVESAVDDVVSAGHDGTWRASSWWLERLHGDTFGPTTKVKLQSAESLEAELIELLGPETGAEAIEGARRKIAALREQYEAVQPELREHAPGSRSLPPARSSGLPPRTALDT